MHNLSDFLTVKQAANILGICTETLRRWDRSGKLKSFRHPLNGYRLYLGTDLTHFLNSFQEGHVS